VDGVLMSGYIDLVSAEPEHLNILDFKTDAPPTGAIEVQYSGYVRQVHAYASLLASAGIAGSRTTRCGLLFTADGTIRWTPAASDSPDFDHGRPVP
jgi:ATP-dependent helicase/nuclease subunit A